MASHSTDKETPVAAFGWDRRRARTLFWTHFPLALLHLPLAFAVIGLPGFMFFGWFALRSFRRLRHGKPVFELYEHGFVDRRHGLVRRYRYEALAGYSLIDQLWRFPFPFGFIRIQHLGLVTRIERRHFVVNEHLENIRECIALMQQGALRQRFAHARQAIDAGSRLQFGHLGMSSAGLHAGKRVLGWASFADVRTGELRSRRRSEHALQIIDATGQPWEIVTRSGLTEPALFIALLAERQSAIDTHALLRDLCGMTPT